MSRWLWRTTASFEWSPMRRRLREPRCFDLRRYTGIPGMIDAHTHMTFYWDQAPGTTPWAQSGRANRGHRLSGAGKRAQDAGNRRHHGARSGRFGLCRYRHARPDHRRNDGRSAHVRGGLRPAVTDQPARPVTFPTRRTATAWPRCARCAADRAPGADQDVRLHRNRSGCHRFAHLFVRGDPGRGGCRARLGKLAIHTYGPDGARDAVRAGADSLEHATDMDDETIAEMARRGTFYVPTIDHNRYYADIPSNWATAKRWQASERLHQAQPGNRAEGPHSRRPFAMGSDAVFTMFGENTRELDWLVKAGMTPEQALRPALATARHCWPWRRAWAPSRRLPGRHRGGGRRPVGRYRRGVRMSAG